MFGKRTSDVTTRRPPKKPAATPPAPESAEPQEKPTNTSGVPADNGQQSQSRQSEEYCDVKTTVFNALIDTIDLTQLSKLDNTAARAEIGDIVSEIIQIKNVVMSISEQEEMLEEICNDVLGYGPWSHFWRAMISPTSWSMVRARHISRPTVRLRRQVCGSATICSL